MQIDIRKADQGDQAAITTIVRRAHLNPRGLAWRGFVVAERNGSIVGVAQVRVHRDGTHELASLVVRPSLQGRGIASRMIAALLADDRGEMYTLIDRRFADHFRQWGFLPVDSGRLPRSMLRTYRIGRVVTGIASILTRKRVRIVPLRRA
jgi:N-acetylglutamate synthase-like GNAT family acetyltransferase